MGFRISSPVAGVVAVVRRSENKRQRATRLALMEIVLMFNIFIGGSWPRNIA